MGDDKEHDEDVSPSRDEDEESTRRRHKHKKDREGKREKRKHRDREGEDDDRKRDRSDSPREEKKSRKDREREREDSPREERRSRKEREESPREERRSRKERDDSPRGEERRRRRDRDASPERSSRRRDRDDSPATRERRKERDGDKKKKERERRSSPAEEGEERGDRREEKGDRREEKGDRRPRREDVETTTTAESAAAVASGGEVRAQVSESGGEISCSIEETNRLRASLGLKPLVVEDQAKKKREQEAARAQAAEEQQKEKEREAIEEKLYKMKKKRELNATVAGATLGDAEDDVDDTAAWVARSRAKAEAARKAKLLDEMDAEAETQEEYTAQHLAGLKVLHDAREFEEGVTIMTLADRDVLDDDAGDELQNVDLADAQRTKKNNELRRTNRRYDATDASEWDEHGRPQSKSVLAKYDDEKGIEGIKLDGSGTFDQAKADKLQEIRAKLAQGPTKTEVSLAMDTQQKIREYYTADELVAFKPKEKKKRLRKKKKDTLDLEPEEGANDHGSRADAFAARDAKDRTNAAEKDERYARALEAAHEKSRVIGDEVSDALSGKRSAPTAEGTEVVNTVGDLPPSQTGSGGETVKVKSEPVEHSMASGSASKPDEDEWEDLGDDDEELRSTLDRARRLALKKEAVTHEEQIAATLGDSDEEEENKGGQLSFSATAEFCRSIQTTIPKTEAPPAQEQPAQKEKTVVGHAAHTDDTNWVMDVEEGAIEQGSDSDSDEAILDKETVAGRGLGGALKLLRMSHAVVDEGDDVFYGRSTDAVPPSNRQEKLKICEYLDEKGRKLTQKEAFRQFSHKFHGKQPGKLKLEKREKKYQEEQKMKKLDTTEKSLKTMQALKNHQGKSHSPFIVLSGKATSNMDGYRKDTTDGTGEVDLRKKRPVEGGDGGADKKARK